MVARSTAPFDPAVVAPWSLGESDRGVLLLHGFAGTPPELRRLGEHLAANRWRCSAPALAGHGTTPEEHARTGRRDWTRSAQAALDDLGQHCSRLAVAGQSMGGALALHLAATDQRIEALATLAAPVQLADPRLRLLRWVPKLTSAYRWHSPDPDDIDLGDPSAVAELHSYGRRSTHSILELTRLLDDVTAELPMVRASALLLHGGRDRTVDPVNLDLISKRLVCSREVSTTLYPGSGHAMSVDVDREAINTRVLEWFDRWVPPVSVPPD